MPIAPPPSGTVYTPDDLANALVSAVLPKGPHAMVLEPSFGEGAFLRALNSCGVPPERIYALDLSAKNSPTQFSENIIRGTDFLTWGKRTSCRFDLIVGNPPYVAIRQIHPALRATAIATKGPDRRKIGASANYWYAFFCASLNLLNRGGNLAFILPAAWEYASYASPLKQRIPRLFGEVEAHRVDSPLFDKVEDGCIVIIARGFGSSCATIRQFSHKDKQSLIVALRANSGRPIRQKLGNKISQVRARSINSIACLKIGAVTGDAHFFLMSESQKQKLGLPDSAFIRVVSKSRHIHHAFIDQEIWEGLRKSDERVWLFRPSPDHLQDSAVKKYLNLARREGGCNKKAYWVANREPWYRTELPTRVDAVVSGMVNSGPWLSISRMKNLSVTNTLYFLTFRERFSLDEKAAWAISLITTAAYEQIDRKIRHYASGLNKIEPGDLKTVLLPIPKATSSAMSAYSRILGIFLSGDTRNARNAADRWILTGSF